MPAGRPFEAVPALRELEPCDPKTIAPLNSDGFPDLMNYLPTRLIPLDEAKQRGWPLFYQAEACRYGHVAPRYVSNPRQCVDCFRLKRGKQLISAAPVTAAAEYKRPYKQREPTLEPGKIAAALPPVEPDRNEKAFIAAYAEHKDLDVAAASCGMTGAQVIARLSWSKVFSNAVRALEEKLGLTNVPVFSGPYEWDDQKRKRLVAIFVDTGDIATARDSIRVTPSEYFKELERNTEFSAMMDEATPLALKALEERATQLALAGNDKLLTKILSAKLPEYRDRVSVDMNVNEKLSDEQLNTRLARLFGKYGKQLGITIDGECTEVIEPAGQIAAPQNDGGDGAPSVSQSNQDLL